MNFVEPQELIQKHVEVNHQKRVDIANQTQPILMVIYHAVNKHLEEAYTLEELTTKIEPETSIEIPIRAVLSDNSVIDVLLTKLNEDFQFHGWGSSIVHSAHPPDSSSPKITLASVTITLWPLHRPPSLGISLGAKYNSIRGKAVGSTELSKSHTSFD